MSLSRTVWLPVLRTPGYEVRRVLAGQEAYRTYGITSKSAVREAHVPVESRALISTWYDPGGSVFTGSFNPVATLGFPACTKVSRPILPVSVTGAPVFASRKRIWI